MCLDSISNENQHYVNRKFYQLHATQRQLLWLLHLNNLENRVLRKKSEPIAAIVYFFLFLYAGLNLTLYHIPGETDDQIGVYIPRDNAFLSGDDFYQAFPNIYTIRGATARNAVDWYTSLVKIIDIEPEHLIPSHGSPFSGKQVIRDLLTPYRDAIQYVHDQTVRLMNKGKVCFCRLLQCLEAPWSNSVDTD